MAIAIAGDAKKNIAKMFATSIMIKMLCAAVME